MAAKLDAQTLAFVFEGRSDLLAGIQKAADSPARITLFNNIASHIYDRLSGTAVDDGPSSKRRRVDIATPTQTTGSQNGQVAGPEAAARDPVLLEIKEISMSVPQRKKYSLCFTKNFLYARVAGTDTPVQGIIYPWRDIEHAFYLPVPDKSQIQHNYPLVFTVPATAPKPGTVSGPSSAAAEPVSDTYSSLFHWALTTSLRAAGNHACALVASDPKLFHSAARPAFRPADKAVHVKAFRGSKDGFLFFLPTGILWGFKKPLLFLPLDRIVAVSYTSVLQRTFNIVVEFERDGEQAEEIEFAMVDQEDYGGIDENYVRRHGLADRSMADGRKAKRQLAENAKKEKGGEGEGEGGEEGGEDDGLTELERAQKEAEQALQDAEDEEEEDYDPGSDGESEGSGSSDEEEEGGEGGEGGDGDGDDDDMEDDE
ncbi:hypothetical protein B0T18DRAFT_440832 [Schizothecium vesticola]|uniref:Histone chaperone RTT106/FACT complex subunit SPT16-like middle domain-containing protein n=1 Tax=Schizothecium vesticola TaxID=314040 RepID=A0AA40BP59_9PEZI|nr:hypothetical protein B0T18DRAFT_440832 [Schizothecium vesticola]